MIESKVAPSAHVGSDEAVDTGFLLVEEEVEAGADGEAEGVYAGNPSACASSHFLHSPSYSSINGCFG